MIIVEIIFFAIYIRLLIQWPITTIAWSVVAFLGFVGLYLLIIGLVVWSSGGYMFSILGGIILYGLYKLIKKAFSPTSIQISNA